MSKKKIIIYSDESVEKGRYFSHFYGGAILPEENIHEIETQLLNKKNELGITAEMKWNKITPQFKQQYIEYIELFLNLMIDGRFKMRIMFQQNDLVPINLTTDQLDNSFLRLYYQFIKHGFGLSYLDKYEHGYQLKLNLDDLPTNKKQVSQFKHYLSALNESPEWRRVNLNLNVNDISNIDSKKHCILQGVDIVLGAMQSKLNNIHTKTQNGERRRSKRAKAKSTVYDTIISKINITRPNFNVGISTGTDGNLENRYKAKYAHWNFKPKSHRPNNDYIPKRGKPQRA